MALTITERHVDVISPRKRETLQITQDTAGSQAETFISNLVRPVHSRCVSGPSGAVQICSSEVIEAGSKTVVVSTFGAGTWMVIVEGF